MERQIRSSNARRNGVGEFPRDETSPGHGDHARRAVQSRRRPVRVGSGVLKFQLRPGRRMNSRPTRSPLILAVLTKTLSGVRRDNSSGLIRFDHVARRPASREIRPNRPKGSTPAGDRYRCVDRHGRWQAVRWVGRSAVAVRQAWRPPTPQWVRTAPRRQPPLRARRLKVSPPRVPLPETPARGRPRAAQPQRSILGVAAGKPVSSRDHLRMDADRVRDDRQCRSLMLQEFETALAALRRSSGTS